MLYAVKVKLVELDRSQRLPDYLRAPLTCLFNPLRLPLGRLIRATNSAVVSSRFSRFTLGLDRTIIAHFLFVLSRVLGNRLLDSVIFAAGIRHPSLPG